MTVYRVFAAELSALLDILLAGEVVSDRATTERLVRSVGTLAYLHERHTIDAHGRCTVCRQPSRHWWLPWSKRSTCSVHAALSVFLGQPSGFVVSALIDTTPAPSGKSRRGS